MSRTIRIAACAALAAAGIGLASVPATAQGYYAPPAYAPPAPGYGSTNTPGIDRRQRQQEYRERAGEAAGVISPREGRAIDRAQRDLRRHESLAKRDGVVTRQERRDLRDHSRHVDGTIRQTERNREVAPYYGGTRW